MKWGDIKKQFETLDDNAEVWIGYSEEGKPAVEVIHWRDTDGTDLIGFFSEPQERSFLDIKSFIDLENSMS